MSRYRRGPIPGATYFFTVNTYRRQPLLTHEEVITALRSAHRAVRVRYPFRVDAMVVLPDHFHALWTLPPEEADYSTRLSLLKRHVSQTVRHLLSPDQSASRHKRRELALWQRRFWEHQIRDEGDYARHIDYVHYNPSSMGSSPRFVLGRILPFTDTSGSESIHTIGRVALSLDGCYGEPDE